MGSSFLQSLYDLLLQRFPYRIIPKVLTGICHFLKIFIKKGKTKHENDFFQQKETDIHNQRPSFVYKMKTPQKWQIPLKFSNSITGGKEKEVKSIFVEFFFLREIPNLWKQTYS